MESSETNASPFLALPAELRADIYDLVFDISQAGSIQLLSAAAPTKALLLACRQTHHEAKGMYKDAYRRYWLETDFSLQLNSDWDSSRTAVEFTSEDLAHIQHLHFRANAHALVALHNLPSNPSHNLLRWMEERYSPSAEFVFTLSERWSGWTSEATASYALVATELEARSLNPFLLVDSGRCIATQDTAADRRYFKSRTELGRQPSSDELRRLLGISIRFRGPDG